MNRREVHAALVRITSELDTLRELLEKEKRGSLEAACLRTAAMYAKRVADAVAVGSGEVGA